MNKPLILSVENGKTLIYIICAMRYTDATNTVYKERCTFVYDPDSKIFVTSDDGRYHERD